MEKNDVAVSGKSDITASGNPGYNTKQKELVLDYIKSMGKTHITALDIARKLETNDTPVGISTVYRQLEKLARAGIVRKYTPVDRDGACYEMMEEAAEDSARHFHLKCTGCGDLIHTDCDFMNEMDEHIQKHHKFIVDSSKTVLYGRCEKCTETRETHK